MCTRDRSEAFTGPRKYLRSGAGPILTITKWQMVQPRVYAFRHSHNKLYFLFFFGSSYSRFARDRKEGRRYVTRSCRRRPGWETRVAAGPLAHRLRADMKHVSSASAPPCLREIHVQQASCEITPMTYKKRTSVARMPYVLGACICSQHHRE